MTIKEFIDFVTKEKIDTNKEMYVATNKHISKADSLAFVQDETVAGFSGVVLSYKEKRTKQNKERYNGRT